MCRSEEKAVFLVRVNQELLAEVPTKVKKEAGGTKSSKEKSERQKTFHKQRGGQAKN